MTRLRIPRASALAALTTFALGATATAQTVPTRPAAGARALPDEARPAQVMTWYPHELRPPFFGETLEPDQDTPDVIHAGNAVFEVGDPPDVPPELALPDVDPDAADDAAFRPGWFLVHFERPLDREHHRFLDRVLGAITREDGSPLSRWYVPNNAVAVHVGTRAEWRALEAHEHVDWVGRYQPAWKLDPTIGTAPLTSPERRDRTVYRLTVDLVPGAELEPVARQLEALGAQVLARVVIPGRRTYDARFLVVDAAPGVVTRLALVEGVRTIQEEGDGLATYDLSGGGKLQARTLTADDGSASPIVTPGNFPLWRVHDLQGQGQLIGVVDTSMDWNNTGLSGCASGFPDTAIDNWGFALPNLSRVLLGAVGSGGVNLKIPRSDQLGGATLGSGLAGGEHGVGVAGAALGDFYGNNDTKWWEHDVDTWESWAPTNFSGLLGPGIAHEAQLYFTSVMDSANGFRWESPGEFPTNMGITLNNMAAAGVCTTNHSVGLAESSNTYTQTSVVHDLRGFDHPQMLQCMAAGNSGAGTNRLTSQAVVKNALAVGASDDVLRPENRVTFSSTGPRFDGALKPDVMAPGDDTFPRTSGVASLLILPDSNGTGGGSCSYIYTSGTSFASPTMAGAGALVHQYFEEGRYPGSASITDPSAALIKAMLINAGHRLTGSNLGDGTYPNFYQGWGEPNLSQVLDLGGARHLIASDVASAGGFTSSGSTPHTVTFDVDGSAERLRVTLAWTDEPGSTGTGKKLINDLDLRVTRPGGSVYLGNSINGSTGESVLGGSVDTLNNVENVIVSSPLVGTWTATIDPGPGNYSVGQGYALVITGDVSESGGGPAAPVANFSGTPLSGTAPLNVSFSDLSTGSITTWAWSFGDLGTSNLQNPSHNYTSPGTYTVSLTVTGPGGSDGETKTGYVTVNAPPTGGGRYYLTFDSNTVVPGVGTVADEDVVTYDVGTGAWALYFDGSDVGLAGTDINALHVLADGDLVMSFDSTSFSVPGLTGGPSGTTVEDSDLVIFSFTQSGPSTSGSFQFVFDGSDVGLTTSNEDIDGVYEFPGGGLAISLLGNGSVPGASPNDEDLLFFSATQYGATTAGSWSLYFDGSDVGFSTTADEDLNAVSFDEGVDLLFSTLGNWSAAGGAGADEDVGRFAGTFGSATSGSAALELDLSALGIDPAEDVDGMCFVP